MQEEVIMIDQEMDLPVAKRLERSERLDRMALPADIGQAAAAIIAITRHEWMSQGHVSPAPDDTTVNRTHFAHPLLRFALDAKRSSAWRARASRQGRTQSAERFPDLNRTLEDMT